MEIIVVGLIEALFVIACLVVGLGLTVALFQALFDSTQKRAYENKKRWDEET
jgi:flagellar biosynthesis protein FliQ